MALINCPECGRSVSDKAISCPECGKEISDKAVACPHCGNPMNPQVQQTQQEEYLCLGTGELVGAFQRFLKLQSA